MTNMVQNYLVTGASSFLGKSFVDYLVEKTDTKVLSTSRKTLPDRNLNCSRFKHLEGIDLTCEVDLIRLLEECNSFFNGKFHVINCVGFFPRYDNITSISVNECKQILNSNVLAYYGTAHILIPLMIKRGGGHFIGFTSHTVYQDYPEMVAFTASKRAVESIVKGIANEYFKDGIISNCFALATLLTKVEKQMKPLGDHQNWLDTVEVCKEVIDFISTSSSLVSGNIIHLYKYSESYFHESYYQRINKNQ
jgi:short-subunit dehydrogenase